MSIEAWQALGIVSGSLAAAIVVVTWAAKGLRRMWRLMSKANRWLDQVLGEPAQNGQPARPSLMQRVEHIEKQLARHLEWHDNPAGQPARGGQKPVDGRRSRP